MGLSLSLVLFSLLHAFPAHAQSGYPGGGSGYPGGGSGGPTADPGHYWKITYSSSGTTSYAIPDQPRMGESTPYSYPWNPTDSGGGTEDSTDINGKVTGSVTLTWIPATGKTGGSDPPSKKVFIRESSFAEESPGDWRLDEAFRPPSVGSADNGLGDAQVAWNSGYQSSGVHQIQKDGSSGTITLGPFTLTATCPVSKWLTDSTNFPIYYYSSWDWMGGLCAAGFGVAVDPPPHPINFRLGTRSDGTPNVDILDDGELTFHYVWDSSSGSLSDLDKNNCMVYENVTYAGGSTGQIQPNPFTGVLYYYPPDPFTHPIPEPTQLGVPGSDGACADDQRYGTGNKSNDFSTPYKAASFSGIQNFFYHSDDLASGEFPVLLGPLTISRRVYQGVNPNDWFYDVSKSGYSSTQSLSF